MLKKKDFWIGFLAGAIVFLFYSWFSIWATYTALERQSKVREADLQKIKRVIFSVDTIEQERAAIKEWNEQHVQSKPTAAVLVEEQ